MTIPNWLRHLAYKLYPPFLLMGVRVKALDANQSEVAVSIPLSWRTRNFHGTIYGGFIYAAVDGIAPELLWLKLGKSTVKVWSKESRIYYLNPARSTLHGVVRVGDELVKQMTTEIARNGKGEVWVDVHLFDKDECECAKVELLIHARRRDYESRKQ
jgi:hypothetical protein